MRHLTVLMRMAPAERIGRLKFRDASPVPPVCADKWIRLTGPPVPSASSFQTGSPFGFLADFYSIPPVLDPAASAVI